MAARRLVTVAGSGDKPRTPTTPLADDDDDFEYAPAATVVRHKRKKIQQSLAYSFDAAAAGGDAADGEDLPLAAAEIAPREEQVEGEVEGQGEGQGESEDKGEDGLASQNQELAPVIEKKEGEGEEQLDDGTNPQSLVTSEGEEKKEDELQQPAAVLASEEVVADEQQTPIGEVQGNLGTANEEEQGNLATANKGEAGVDNLELPTAAVEPGLATASAPVVESEEELKKKEEQ
jgi:hypothetical protein